MALQLDPQEPVKGVSVRDDEDAHNRQRIRRAVLEGDIDRAMKYTDAYYPAVLRDNEQVYFRLRCRKFIEMIRKEAEHNIMLEERGVSHTNGRGQAAGDNDEEMFEAEPGHNGTTTANGDGDLDMTMAEAGDGAGGSDPAAGLSKLSQEALLYGVELQAEFAGDSRRETVKQLDDISSLFAYPNPLKVKEVAHLLDGSGRVAVAEELNSAILSKLLLFFFVYVLACYILTTIYSVTRQIIACGAGKCLRPDLRAARKPEKGRRRRRVCHSRQRGQGYTPVETALGLLERRMGGRRRYTVLAGSGSTLRGGVVGWFSRPVLDGARIGVVVLSVLVYGARGGWALAVTVARMGTLSFVFFFLPLSVRIYLHS